MRSILWRIVCLGGFAVTGLVVLLALLLSISRVALPALTDYRQEIQAYLGEMLGREISIGKINARWQQATPQIKLVDVGIYDATGSRTELTVNSIFFSLDIVDTLRSGALRIKEIGIRGCDISIVRNRDHAIAIHGLELGILKSMDSVRLGSVESVVQSKINLIGCQVSWKDEISGKDYRFKGVNATVSSEDGHKRIAARFTPSGRNGRQLTVLIEFQGQLDRPSGWQGRLYVDAQDLRLEDFLPDAMLREYGLERGRLKLENWSEWRQGKPVRMLGTLSLSDARMSSPPMLRASARDIDLIQAHYEWQSSTQGWRLRVDGLKTVIDGKSWPESGFSLDYRFDKNTHRQFRGTVDYVDLKHIPSLLPPLTGFAQELKRRWQRLALSGELNDVRFFLCLDEGRIDRYRLSAGVRDLGVESQERIPGVAGLDGWIELSESGGEAVVESRNVLLDYPQAFVNTLSANYLSGVLTWSSEDGVLDIHSESLHVGNEDIEIQGGGNLVFGSEAPHIDVKLSYGHGNGAKLEHYLPKKIMPEKVHKWLVGSIGDVLIRSGTAVIRGKASEFPFGAGEGVFEASAVLEEGRLDYKPGWPVLDDIHAYLVFRGHSMEITKGRARTLDSRLSGVEVTIEDLRHAELKMQAEVNGPLSDVWRYSSQTVLPKQDKRIVKDLKLVGNSRMILNINLPLSGAIDNREKVTGELHMSEAALELEEPYVKFDNISGKLDFGPKGAQGQGIRADLHGRPVMISARPADAGTLVEIRGRFGAADLAMSLTDDYLKEVLDRSLTGTSDWLAQVSIPHGQLKNENRVFGFRAWSDLHGTEVNAPEPLKKAADEQEAFYMSADLGADGSLPLQIRYGKRLSMALSMQISGDEYAMQGGGINLYRGQAVVPSEGLRVQGSLEKCSMDEWHTWAQRIFNVNRHQESSWGFEHFSIDVDIDFDLVELFTAMRLKTLN